MIGSQTQMDGIPNGNRCFCPRLSASSCNCSLLAYTLLAAFHFDHSQFLNLSLREHWKGKTKLLNTPTKPGIKKVWSAWSNHLILNWSTSLILIQILLNCLWNSIYFSLTLRMDMPFLPSYSYHLLPPLTINDEESGMLHRKVWKQFYFARQQARFLSCFENFKCNFWIVPSFLKILQQ